MKVNEELRRGKKFKKTQKIKEETLAIQRVFWYHIKAFHTGVDFPPCGSVAGAWWRG